MQVKTKNMEIIFQKIYSLENQGFFFRITCKDNWVLDSHLISYGEEQGFKDKDEVVEFYIPMITPMPDEEDMNFTNNDMANILVSQAAQLMLAAEVLLAHKDEEAWIEQAEQGGVLLEYILCISYLTLINNPKIQVISENSTLN